MSRSRWATLLLLLLPVSGCSLFEDPTVQEAAEIATMGGERPLREPMRPIRGGTRVLVLALDGVGWDDLNAALHSGAMANLGSLIGARAADGSFERGHLVPMLTVLPSATTPAWAAIFTGGTPGATGIPGNEWFDRKTMRFYAPVPITVSSRDHAAELYTDGLMGTLLRMPTIYERADLRSHVGFHPVHRGADLLTLPDLGEFGGLTAALAEGLVTDGTAQTEEVFRETDLSNARSAIQSMAAHGVPDVQTIYFPGIDLFTHREQDPIAAQQRYLTEVTDRGIGLVIEGYRQRGALEGTYILIVSDHGHIPRLEDDAHALHVDGEDEPTAVIEAAGFRLRPNELEPEAADYQAAVAFQGGMAYLYLADRSTCPGAGETCDWTQPPRMEEDVVELARAIHTASTNPGLPGGLYGAVDLILVRSTGTLGEAPPFQVFDGERVIPISEYLSANPRPDLVDLERRLEWLATGAHGHLAGDILLIPHTSPDRPVEERFYFGPPYWSEHGSPYAQDSRVPLLLARPGRSATDLKALIEGLIPGEATQMDFAGLVLALLEEPETSAGRDP